MVTTVFANYRRGYERESLMEKPESPMRQVTLGDLKFVNPFTTELSGDQDLSNTRRQVHDAYYSRVFPTPTAAPKTLIVSEEVRLLLGISSGLADSDEFAEVFSGNAVTADMDPHAMCYGGHQFGNWAGQLGDGRAINLGELQGIDSKNYMLQLKGAGPTPYSRSGDGRAVLRSSIREYLCSEAMHYLHVPTTRALSLCNTGDNVVRDMFYDGNLAEEIGAVVCRVAESFIRFGSFEIFSARENIDGLKALLDFTIKHHFSEISDTSPEKYVDFYREVISSTALLMAHWQRVGFVHGVMNTDNMSIHGLTIDYGPYGWVDDFDPDWTPNTTDRHQRRYRFRNQPAVGHWNLAQLANAIYPVVGSVEPLQEALDEYEEIFSRSWSEMIAAKLGLVEYSSSSSQRVITDLFSILETGEIDMTIFFRSLSSITVGSDISIDEISALLKSSYYEPVSKSESHWETLRDWIENYRDVLRGQEIPDDRRKAQMDQVNPKYVLRNYLAQLAIDSAEQGDLSMLYDLQTMLKTPYDDQPQFDKWAVKRPDWAKDRAGCSMLSCSS